MKNIWKFHKHLLVQASSIFTFAFTWSASCSLFIKVSLTFTFSRRPNVGCKNFYLKTKRKWKASPIQLSLSLTERFFHLFPDDQLLKSSSTFIFIFIKTFTRWPPGMMWKTSLISLSWPTSIFNFTHFSLLPDDQLVRCERHQVFEENAPGRRILHGLHHIEAGTLFTYC